MAGSTVVPFSQEDSPAPDPSQSGIDSQEEVPPAAAPPETSTKENDRTLNEIKLRLLEFFDTLEAHDRQEISQHEPNPKYGLVHSQVAGYQMKIDRGWWATEKAEGLCHQEGLRAGTACILWKKEMLERIKEYLAAK